MKQTELTSDNITKTFSNYVEKNKLNIVLISQNNGHTVLKGCETGIKNKNPYFHIFDIDRDEEYIFMKCNNDIFTKISILNINEIKSTNSSWFLCKNGYIASNFNGHQIYLHQFLMNYYGNGKGKMSIDHINRNKLDNRIENLRIVDQSTQNKNCDKRNRKYNAQNLPPEISKMQIPKYCYYCSEVMNKGKPNQYIREFFRIEKHPNLKKKCVSTSKSTKISIINKLKEAIELLKKLDNNKSIEKVTKLPKYIRMYKSKRTSGKLVLVYERRVDGERQCSRLTFNAGENIEEKLKKLVSNISNKYKYEIDYIVE